MTNGHEYQPYIELLSVFDDINNAKNQLMEHIV